MICAIMAIERIADDDQRLKSIVDTLRGASPGFFPRLSIGGIPVEIRMCLLGIDAQTALGIAVNKGTLMSVVSLAIDADGAVVDAIEIPEDLRVQTQMERRNAWEVRNDLAAQMLIDWGRAELYIPEEANY